MADPAPRPALRVVEALPAAGLSERSDEDLINGLTRRELAMLAALYDRYSRPMFALAYRILGDGSTAEDVVQDAFLSAWRGVETFRRERGTVRNWLLSITHHRAVDVLRRRTAFRPGTLEAALTQPSEADTFAEADRNVRGRAVREALAALPAAQRTTIELAYFAGYTQSELAELLGIPLGTVKGRMRIGLLRLRRALEALQ
jgi:RNA polymerase sigma-70 factor (ECF subfamily)